MRPCSQICLCILIPLLPRVIFSFMFHKRSQGGREDTTDTREIQTAYTRIYARTRTRKADTQGEICARMSQMETHSTQDTRGGYAPKSRTRQWYLTKPQGFCRISDAVDTASVRYRTPSIGQNGHQRTGKISLPILSPTDVYGICNDLRRRIQRIDDRIKRRGTEINNRRIRTGREAPEDMFNIFSHQRIWRSIRPQSERPRPKLGGRRILWKIRRGRNAPPWTVGL